MRKILFILAAMIASSTAFAQAPPSAPPELKFCQKAVVELQAQRNSADDRAAQLGAQLAILNEELTAAQKELAELKKKVKEPDAEQKPKAGQVHGNVSPQPEHGKAEGSASCGGEGVQPSGR